MRPTKNYIVKQKLKFGFAVSKCLVCLALYYGNIFFLLLYTFYFYSFSVSSNINFFLLYFLVERKNDFMALKRL